MLQKTSHNRGTDLFVPTFAIGVSTALQDHFSHFKPSQCAWWAKQSAWGKQPFLLQEEKPWLVSYVYGPSWSQTHSSREPSVLDSALLTATGSAFLHFLN